MYDKFNIGKAGLYLHKKKLFLGNFPSKISQCSCHFEKYILEMKYSSSKKMSTPDKAIGGDQVVEKATDVLHDKMFIQ